MPEEREHDFDFDLLDATKLIPEEEVPLRVVGRMELDRNPDNFFAETEQVAFHTANVVPGIDFTNDPLLQARNFSYLDTQLIRLGGPNFAQLPVNRPVAEVHHHQRDGYGQHRIDVSPVSYHPNTIGGGCPALASFDEGGYRHYTERVDGPQDPRAQRELQGPLQPGHAVLELDERLGARPHRRGVQLRARQGAPPRDPRARARRARPRRPRADLACRREPRSRRAAEAEPNHGRSSPALSQADQPESVATRKVAVLAADGVDASSIRSVLEALQAEGAICEVLAPHEGALEGGLDVDRGLLTMASVLYDAVLVAGGRKSVDALQSNGAALRYVAEAYKHGKAVGAVDEGVDLLRAARLGDPRLSDDGLVDEHGVVTVALAGADRLEDFTRAFARAVASHRHFDRAVDVVSA